jgi:hypothetical protein
VIFILRMRPDLRCHGCGHVGFADGKSMLCASCCGVELAKHARHQELAWKLSAADRAALQRIAEQLRVFR